MALDTLTKSIALKNYSSQTNNGEYSQEVSNQHYGGVCCLHSYLRDKTNKLSPVHFMCNNKYGQLHIKFNSKKSLSI
jgi:hypothetical protein